MSERFVMDLTALPQAGHDFEVVERRERARLRMKRGLVKQIRDQDAEEKAARGDRVEPRRVGDRWGVVVMYRVHVGGALKIHASLPVFTSEEEARTRGEYFLTLIRAKEIRP